MRLRLGAPRAALIVAPHPDDEVIGCALLIEALVARGTRVHILIVTDGAASHPGSRSWPRHRLMAKRKAESRAAMKHLGLPAGRIRHLDLSDGQLDRHQSLCTARLRRAVAQIRRLDLIAGPLTGDDHPDHRAVAVALAAIRTPARRLGYHIWPAGVCGHAAALPPRPGHVTKRALLAGFRSQTGLIQDDPDGFAFSHRQIAAFTHPVERFVRLRAGQ